MDGTPWHLSMRNILVCDVYSIGRLAVKTLGDRVQGGLMPVGKDMERQDQNTRVFPGRQVQVGSTLRGPLPWNHAEKGRTTAKGRNGIRNVMKEVSTLAFCPELAHNRET